MIMPVSKIITIGLCLLLGVARSCTMQNNSVSLMDRLVRLECSSKTAAATLEQAIQDHQPGRRLIINPFTSGAKILNKMCDRNTYCKGVKDIGKQIFSSTMTPAAWGNVGHCAANLVATWYDFDVEVVEGLIKGVWTMDLGKILENGGDLMFNFAGNALGSDTENIKLLLKNMCQGIKRYRKSFKLAPKSKKRARKQAKKHFQEVAAICKDIGRKALAEKIGAKEKDIKEFCDALRARKWKRVAEEVGDIIVAITVHQITSLLWAKTGQKEEFIERQQKLLSGRRRMFGCRQSLRRDNK